MNKYIKVFCFMILCMLSICACGNKTVNVEKYIDKFTGNDGIMLVYADSDNAIFYSDMGIFNYDLLKKRIVNCLDFEDNLIEYTNGDYAYAISASKTGDAVIMYGANGINNWKYTLKDNKFEKINKDEIGELFSGCSEIVDYEEGYFDDKPGNPEGMIVKNEGVIYYITGASSLHKDAKLVTVSDSGCSEYMLFE